MHDQTITIMHPTLHFSFFFFKILTFFTFKNKNEEKEKKWNRQEGLEFNRHK